MVLIYSMKRTGVHASIGLSVVSALDLLRHVSQIEVDRERAGQRRCRGDVYGIKNRGSCGRVAADSQPHGLDHLQQGVTFLPGKRLAQEIAEHADVCP